MVKKSLDRLKRLYHKNNWSIAFLPEEGSLQYAILEESSSGPILTAYGSDPSPEAALQKISLLHPDSLYISSIFPSLPTLCRQLTLPKLSQKELASALSDALEQSLPSDMNESTFTYESSFNDKGSFSVTAYVARKTALREHLSTVSALSIEPENVLPKAACLAAFIAFFHIQDWSYVIDVSEKETSVVLTFNGKAIESRALIGGMNLFSCIHHPSSDSDKGVHQLLQHVSETIFAFQEQYGLEEDVPCTITGKIVSIDSAPQTISDFIKVPLSPLHSIEDQEALIYASTTGGAFLSLPRPNSSPIPNLRFRDFPFTNNLLHWKRPVATLLAAAVFLSAFLYWYGSVRSETITKEMNQDWKVFSRTPEAESLSPDEVLFEANALLSKLERRSLFPLHPDVPRLSDLICWLSTQIEEIEQTVPQEAEKLSLQNLHYLLVKRPSKKNPKEKYQVRIDLELSSSSVALARAFHDRLLTQNDFIDPSLEVKWTAMNGKYRTSFFLKDKTFYPPQQV